VRSVFHCTPGDGLIAATSFLLTASALRTTAWPGVAPWRGALIVSVLGFTYTIWSEYRNVYLAHHWMYTASMPTLLGIDVSPLLQWLTLPVATLRLWRRLGC